MAWKWYDSQVTKIVDETPTTKRFWVEVPEVEQIDFVAGQFVTMDLPIADKRLKRWRSYSIASGPDGSNQLELCIVKKEGGAGTTYLFEEIEVGSTIRFKGPSGAFCLPEKLKNDLVFICTGTGVTPFRSMLLDIYNNKRAHRNIHLIFGARYENDILYREELEALKEKMDNFDYTITLSRDENWTGHKGYVHNLYLEKYKDVKPDIRFYICGWTSMIDEAVANLIVKMGYDKSQVHYELYG